MNIEVIITDDHQLFIDGIKSILKTEIGISIIGEANDGLQLIKLLDKGLNPDVILMDIRMPVMDGITTTRVLAKDHSDIAVLALSMYDQESDVIEMMEAGAKGYIVKNAGKKEMLEAIYALHSKRSYFSKKIKDSLKHYHERKNSKSRTLTRRETQIIDLIGKGRTSQQIAVELCISKLTVDTHRKNIHKKLRIATNAGLIKYALSHGF